MPLNRKRKQGDVAEQEPPAKKTAVKKSMLGNAQKDRATYLRQQAEAQLLLSFYNDHIKLLAKKLSKLVPECAALVSQYKALVGENEATTRLNQELARLVTSDYPPLEKELTELRKKIGFPSFTNCGEKLRSKMYGTLEDYIRRYNQGEWMQGWLTEQIALLQPALEDNALEDNALEDDLSFFGGCLSLFNSPVDANRELDALFDASPGV